MSVRERTTFVLPCMQFVIKSSAVFPNLAALDVPTCILPPPTKLPKLTHFGFRCPEENEAAQVSPISDHALKIRQIGSQSLPVSRFETGAMDNACMMQPMMLS